MSKLIDLTGKQFGRITVLHRVNSNNCKHHAQWHCKCGCGNEVDISSDKLKSGYTKSCGCFKQDFYNSGGPNKTHGSCKSRIYRIWVRMIRRCCNPNREKFKILQGWDVEKAFLTPVGWAA